MAEIYTPAQKRVPATHPEHALRDRQKEQLAAAVEAAVKAAEPPLDWSAIEPEGTDDD